MRRLFVLVALACVTIGAAACSSSTPKVAPPLAPVDMRGHEQVEIDAHLNQFSPAAIIVDVGTKVTWKNRDSVVHNVKKSADAVDFGAAFGTDTFDPGQSYSFTFAKAGTFFYTCTIHAAMSGKIQVVASSPAPSSPAPSSSAPSSSAPTTVAASTGSQ